MAIGASGKAADGWNRSQILVILLIQLVFILDGIDMQILPVAIPAIVDDWGLPLSAFGTAVAAGHLGAVIGTPLAGMMGDGIGRKPVIVGGVLLFALGTLALAFARTPEELTILRILAGLGLGGCLPRRWRWQPSACRRIGAVALDPSGSAARLRTYPCQSAPDHRDRQGLEKMGAVRPRSGSELG